jgi:uncharacterized protein YndB with AHSA1/START domain
MISADSARGTTMAAEFALHLERVLLAPRALVFRMHTEPNLLAQWWGPKGFTAPGIELDLRVGGSYRITMQPPEGDHFLLSGEFREVDPAARLVYTFRWEPPDPDDRETVVVFSLRDQGDSTAVTIEQQPFATEARRALHEHGWSESLDCLQEVLRSRDR